MSPPARCRGARADCGYCGAACSVVSMNCTVMSPGASGRALKLVGRFIVSRLDTAGSDDSSFKTGVAVKKGTTEIFEWK